MIDPLSINKQGNDRGRQYRTGVYYTDRADHEVIPRCLLEEEKQLGSKIAVELEPLPTTSLAEDYHKTTSRRILEGYCHIDATDAEQPLIDPAAYQKPDQETSKGKIDSRAVSSPKKVRRNVPFHNAYDQTFEGDLCGYYDWGATLLPKDSLCLVVDGQVSPVPLPKMLSTITGTIYTGWSGSKFVPDLAMPSRTCLYRWTKKTKVAYAIVSIRPLCALFQRGNGARRLWVFVKGFEIRGSF